MSTRWAAKFSTLVPVLICCGSLAFGQHDAVKNKAGQDTRGANLSPAKPAGKSEAGAADKSSKDKAAEEKDGEDSQQDAAPADAAPAPAPGGFGGGGGGGRRGRGGAGGPAQNAGFNNKVAYDFSLPSADGKNIPLMDYKGKALLIVNLGRKSSYATQLAALDKLNDEYKSKGLVVIGVPCDEFGDAEPGTEAEIAKSYADAKADFLVAAVSPLSGVKELPLYTYLTKDRAVTDNGAVHWNYTKFLTDKKGKVILRFPPDVAPDSLEMRAALDEVLAGTWKPKTPGGGGGRGGGGFGGGAPPPADDGN
jgi:glutathione peroxidase